MFFFLILENKAEEEKENRSQDKQDHIDKIATNTLKQKTGLHENLKSLSAAVKQKIDEVNYLN